MAACGQCRFQSVPAPVQAPLLQIRRGYRARWNSLALAVELDCGDWTLRIRDSAGATLYTGHRLGSRAAQLAAVEFAIVHVLGPRNLLSPDRLTGELQWEASW